MSKDKLICDFVCFTIVTTLSKIAKCILLCGFTTAGQTPETGGTAQW